MPRKRKEILNVPEPAEFIDLTQDNSYVPEIPRIILVHDETQLDKNSTITIFDETINIVDDVHQLPVLSKANTSKHGLCCPICLDDIAAENKKAMTTPCGHVYCLDCLKSIINIKKKCSICQKSIILQKCIRLHI